MKRLLLVLAACSSKKQDAPPPTPAPAAAAATATPAPAIEIPKLPDGQPLVAKIGPAGGTAQSDDGLLAITIPAGALAAETAISVQEIAVDAPNSPTGRGYRLEPSGTAFAKPIELAFSPMPDDPLDGAVVVTRGAGGWLEPPQRQDGAIIRVTTSHFSDWVRSTMISITPSETSVGTKGMINLRVGICMTHQLVGSTDPAVTHCLSTALVNDFLGLGKLTVNGIAGGNAEVGWVSRGFDGNVDYLAPASPPAQNPVAIGVEIPILPNRVNRRMTAIANVYVADEPSYVTFFTAVTKHAEGDTRSEGFAFWNYNASDRAYHAWGHITVNRVLGCPVAGNAVGRIATSKMTIANGKFTARISGLEVHEAPCQDTAVDGPIADTGGLDITDQPLVGTSTSSDPDFPTTYTWKFQKAR